LNSNPVDLTQAERLPDDLGEALARARVRLGRIGQPLFFLRTTVSTNDVAARLAVAGASDGTTIVAETQTAGRGRLGRTWFSPPGAGLYVSVVMRMAPLAGGGQTGPRYGAPVPLPARLTLLAGVALADAVRTATGLPAEIKWPNDLVFGGRKLAGILAEAAASDGTLEYIVLGVGINIRAVTYPPEISNRASSLEAELGRSVDRGAVLAELLANLSRAQDALARDDVTSWFTRWRSLSPSSDGAAIEWRAPDGLRRGRTNGLDVDGSLLVQANRGVERVVAGEIVWL
jgi:BirA family transcriptional regulator, biotin operon repressor / biotin---[acetyl-CoA-carboxylase] ligase